MLRKPATVAVAALALTLSAGGAYAYWTVSGSGTSTATVATIKPLDIKAANVKGLVMGIAVPITGTISNPNNFQANLLGTQISVKATVDKQHHGCDIKNFTIVAPTTKATKIPANGSIVFDNGSITLLNTTKEQAACQGAVVTLAYQMK